MLPPLSSMFPRSPTRVILVILLLFVLFQLFSLRQPASSLTQEDLCNGLKGLDDVFVILRTGTTEAPKKLPSHFETTLRCVPHYAIFSDFEEEITGHHIYDALAEIDPEVKANHPDFEYYNRLQGKGREAFSAQEIAQWSAAKNTNSGHDSPGWRLDKWKFLPIADKAFRLRPGMKWYVFIESDTFMLWKSLLEWLSKFDASKPYYLGQQMQIGDVVFAYGGAGFAVSYPALKKVVEHRRANVKFYDEFTGAHWAGDCVLGKALADAGVPLTWSFPTLSGDQPADTDFDSAFGGPARKPWCYHVSSYHHLPPSEYARFSEFEYRWNKENSTLLRHNDVFRYYVRPHMDARLAEWDNLSENEQTSQSSFGACRSACEKDRDCVQFSLSGYSCKTSSVVRLGHKVSAAEQTSSGWLMDRVEEFAKRMDATCDNQDWVLP
ncbi:hypothetical protein F4775DRAFT_537415 [Biscogniauxia sp. FL1348]|nr:hypothetical protein F4775DRAFT_537415 [Biscogniauxia sp. FL1348]